MISASLSLSLPRLGWKSTSMPRSLKICTAAGDSASEMRTFGLDMRYDPSVEDVFDEVTRGPDLRVHLFRWMAGSSPAMTVRKRSYAALASDRLVSTNAQSSHWVSTAT